MLISVHFYVDTEPNEEKIAGILVNRFLFANCSVDRRNVAWKGGFWFNLNRIYSNLRILYEDVNSKSNEQDAPFLQNWWIDKILLKLFFYRITFIT